MTFFARPLGIGYTAVRLTWSVIISLIRVFRELGSGKLEESKVEDKVHRCQKAKFSTFLADR